MFMKRATGPYQRLFLYFSNDIMYSICFYSNKKLYTCSTYVCIGRTPSKAPVVSFVKELYPHCLVLVGYRPGFDHDFSIEHKSIVGLMEDLVKRKK